jgi:predicted nucleic acid-binding protein
MAENSPFVLDTNVCIALLQSKAAGEQLISSCIIAATSIVLNATLLSNDEHFLKLQWPLFTAQAI